MIRTPPPDARRQTTQSGILRALFPADLPPGLRGDPGVIGPDGPVWRIVREKAILAGGPAALLLQVAHPLVAAGVAAHSDFESDPLGRLRRTLDSLLTVVFGDRSQAESAVAAVAAVHRPVRGLSSSGTPYRADDPGLGLWVWATLVLAALGTFEDFVGRLDGDDKAAFYEDYKVVGHLFGVTDEVMPPTYADFEGYVRRMVDDVLDVGDDARAIARGIFEATVAGPTWWSRPTVQLAAAALLPPGVRRDYGLPWGRGRRTTYGAIRRLVRPGVRLLPARARYWQHYRAARGRIVPEARPTSG